MIQVKNPSVLRELLVEKYHSILIELILWLLQRYDNIVITSGYRDGDKGVHGTSPCRGVDIRSWNLSRVDSSAVSASELCKDVNLHWQYDPSRPEKLCAILHDAGSGNHIHLQAHSHTVMK